MDKIEIPFMAKDYELKGWEYTIPEGMEAFISDGKVVVRKKESGDERTRKWILEYLYDGLRKADEQFKGQFKSAIEWLEKQKEQKPAEWSEEDKEAFDMCIDAIPKAWKTKSGILLTKWLKDNIHLQSKQEWSKEEKDKLNSIECLIVNANAHGNYLIGDKEAIDLQHFIRSIVKPTTNLAEWSEVDERMSTNILNLISSQITYVTGQGTMSGKQFPTYTKERDWFMNRLKSLRPQKLDASKLENFDPVDVLNRIKTEWPMAWEKVVGKQEWSEEDKQWLSEVYFAIDHSMYSEVERQAMKKYIDSLHSQSKTEAWSEEDEHRMTDAIYFLESAKIHYADTSEIDKTINYLKSLRPSWKPSEVCYGLKGDPDPAGVWKPSEVQMKALSSAKDDCIGDTYEVLDSLYIDLKKL